MKKKVLAVFLIILCIMMVFSTGIFAQDNDKIKNFESETNYLKELTEIEIQEFIIDTNFNMSDQIHIELMDSLKSDVELSKTGKEYPDDFAGVYADEEGRLHIKYVKQSKDFVNKFSVVSNQDKIDKYLKDYKSETNTKKSELLHDYNYELFYESARFSLNYLIDIKNVLSDEEMISLEISKISENVITNKVDFSIVGNNSKEIFELLKIKFPEIDEEAINFITDVPMESPKNNLPNNKVAYSGDAYKIFIGPFYHDLGTIGFNAIRDGVRGIVTSAHGALDPDLDKWEALYLYSNEKRYIGCATRAQCSGSVDAAFIPFNNQKDWESDSRLRTYGTDLFGQIAEVADNNQLYVGAQVRKYGMMSGTDKGKILQTSVRKSIEYNKAKNTRVISDLIEISNLVEDGDSGGPVGLVRPKSPFKLIGIICAGSTTTFVVNINNIKSSLGVKVLTSNGGYK